MTFTRTVAGLLAAFCLVSCDKQEGTAYNAIREPIQFSAIADRTKTVVSDSFLPDSYTIYASAYFTNSTDPANSGDYFLSRPFRNVGGSWVSDPAVFWPTGCKLDFLALACEDESFDLPGKSVWNSGNCTEEVEISIGDGEFLDSELLYAAAAGRTSESGGVSLQFNHTQNWLQFVVSCDVADILRIDRIVIKNVYTGGTLTVSNVISPDAGWSFRGHRCSDLTVTGSEGVILAAGVSPLCSILLPEQEACDISLYYSARTSTDDDWSTALSCVLHHKAGEDPWYYGEKNVFKIGFSLSEITFTSSIEPWTDEEQDIEIEPVSGTPPLRSAFIRN